MSTHSTRRSHNNFIKKYKTRSGYDREKRAMKVLIDNDVKFVTQFIEYCDQSKEIYFEYCLVGSGPAAISFMLARRNYSNQKDRLLWIAGGDFSDDEELIVKNNNL